MGWWFSEKRFDETIFEFIKRKEFSGNEVVGMAIKLGEAYVAWKGVDGKVRAAVVLIDYRTERDRIGLKILDEDMGPYYYRCPEKILALLSPTEDQTALRWRDMCRAEIAKGRSLSGDLTGRLMVYGGKEYTLVRRSAKTRGGWVARTAEGVEYNVKRSILKKAKVINANEVTGIELQTL
jgi:hypothetical protein